VTRRRFLAGFIKAFFSGLAIVYTSVVVAVLYPARLKKKVVRFVPVLDEEDLPRRGVKTVHFSYHIRRHEVRTRAFIVMDQDISHPLHILKIGNRFF